MLERHSNVIPDDASGWIQEALLQIFGDDHEPQTFFGRQELDDEVQCWLGNVNQSVLLDFSVLMDPVA